MDGREIVRSKKMDTTPVRKLLSARRVNRLATNTNTTWVRSVGVSLEMGVLCFSVSFIFSMLLVYRDIFVVDQCKEMIRGSVRLIDDLAEGTGLVVEVGDQRGKLRLANVVLGFIRFACYVCGLIGVAAQDDS